jgi:hypothetical protein
MKVFGDFNKLSKDAMPPKLKKGQSVIYKLLKSPDDPDNPGKITYPVATRIKTMFRIQDKGTGEFVDVGLIRGMDKEKNPIPAPGSYFDLSGTLVLMGGNVAHEELYEVMELSPENASNPDREDTGIEPKFKRVDFVKDSKLRTAKRTVQLEAMTFAADMSEAQSRQLAAALGWDENAEIEIIQDQIGEFAKNKSQEFVDFVENKDQLKNKSIAKKAETLGIIKYDHATKRMLNGTSGQPIATLEIQDGKTYHDAFADWLLGSKDGPKTFEWVDSQVAKIINEKKSKPSKGE